jgi:hypothetical protein
VQRRRSDACASTAAEAMNRLPFESARRVGLPVYCLPGVATVLAKTLAPAAYIRAVSGMRDAAASVGS